MTSTRYCYFWALGLSIVCSWGGQLLSAPPEARPALATRVNFQTVDEMPLNNIIAALTKQTGLELDTSAFDPMIKVRVEWKDVELWPALEDLAARVSGRWEMTPRSKLPRLVKKGSAKVPEVCVDGPFRIAAHDILVRSDFASGRTLYDLTLDIAWEPRLPVFRIDEVPNALQGEDDGKHKLTSPHIKARNPVEGFVARSTFRIAGLTRASKSIESLHGNFWVTLADEMLQFTIADLDKPKESVTKAGVSVALNRISKDGNYWIIDIELKYPPGGPLFESYETYWLGRNRMMLVSPDGSKKFTPIDHEEIGTTLRYRFKEDAAKGLVLADRKGWKIEYETPGVMREVPVKFNLKAIPLP